MKRIKNILLPPPDADARTLAYHRGWVVFALTGLGCCVGLLSLLLAAFSYGKLNAYAIFASYFMNPALLALNLLPAVLLIWLFYFLTGRGWAAFLGSFLPVMGLTVVNYYKIRLRGDPLMAADLRLAAEAGGIVGNYTLELTWLIWLTAGCFALGLAFAALTVRPPCRNVKTRLLGALITAALLAASMPALFTNAAVYKATANERFINRWSDVEVYVSKGCVYPFLYSVREMFPTPPEGYDEKTAAATLAEYPDADIPDERRVSVVGVMLEAFCDLTDFPALAADADVQRVYEPWHALEENSVSGDLLTNIFAGGTVDSEWAFLTGDTEHSEFRKNTDSYVWYLRGQGYDTLFHHPGYGWFYNRQNVNQYLGFARSWFTENRYGTYVDPTSAIWDSDDVLVEQILRDLTDRWSEGKQAFSFSVSYQNHGPYESGYTSGEEYLSADDGLSDEARNIFNNYLKGVSSTLAAVSALTGELEERDEPVVLVLFGDHKPWGGNGNSAYNAIGADFSLSGLDSLYEYYSTPYLIWANSAARDTLGGDWTGDGGDFSPAFLMNKVFELCGWDGPAFMALANEMKAVTPLVHARGLYLQNGALTDALPPEQADVLQKFLCAQYYREQEVIPRG